MGRIVQHTGEPSQLLPVLVVQHRQSLQLGIEIFTLRQVGIRPADEDGLSLQGQRSIHILHSRQHQQYRGLVDPCALHLCLFSVDIQRVKRRKKGRIEPSRIQLYLAPDTVGVDDLPHGDKFRPHRTPPL